MEHKNAENGKNVALRGWPRRKNDGLLKGKSSDGFQVQSLGSIFGLILLAIFMINVFRIASGKENYFTFDLFFRALQEAPTIDLQWLSAFEAFESPIKGGWGAFQFLADFLNFVLGFLGDLFTIIGFVGTGAVQTLLYLLHFIPVLFGY